MLARAVVLAWGSIILGVTGSGCASSDLHIDGAPPASQYLQDFEGEPSGADLGDARFRPSVCRGADLAPPGRPLDVDAFVAFLEAQSLDTRIVRARGDLVFVELTNAHTRAPVRFRVAVTDSPGAAGRELYTALLQRGEGTWGLQRGNLAVLAAPAPTDDVVVIAAKLRLACWGVLMIAGHDDVFVMPGGYTELS